MKNEGGLGSMRKLLAVCLTVNALLIAAVVVLFVKIGSLSPTVLKDSANQVVSEDSVNTSGPYLLARLEDLSQSTGGYRLGNSRIVRNLQTGLASLYKKMGIPWTSTFTGGILSFSYPEPAVENPDGEIDSTSFDAQFPDFDQVRVQASVTDLKSADKEDFASCVSAGNTRVNLNGSSFCRIDWDANVGTPFEGDYDLEYLFVSDENIAYKITFSAPGGQECIFEDAASVDKCNAENVAAKEALGKLDAAIAKTIKLLPR